MKKIILSIMALGAFALNSKAQDTGNDLRDEIMLGIKAGINTSNIYDKNGGGMNTNSKIGFAGGVFFSIPITKFFGVQPELMFAQKGYTATGTMVLTKYEVNRTSNFIEVPVFFALKPSKYVTLLVGPQYSYLIKQTDVYTYGSLTNTQETNYKNSNLRQNILCFVAGLDINYSMFVFSARVGWDVQDNNGDGTSSNPSYKNEWLQTTVGVRF